MAVDLSDRVEDLKNAVNPPGVDLYPAATDDEWAQRILNGFWDAVLEGVIHGYVVDDDGIVTPTTTGGPDMGRELQQLVVLYAAWRASLMALLNLKAEFKAVAGPVSFQTAQSAGVLREVATQIRKQLDAVVARLGDSGFVNTGSYDLVMDRSYSIALGESWWVQ